MERIYKCNNMHWEKTAAMWADGEISSLQKSMGNVRQGCVLSPDLFSLYNETLKDTQEWK